MTLIKLLRKQTRKKSELGGSLPTYYTKMSRRGRAVDTETHADPTVKRPRP
jgi:hypothetical protein